MENVFSFGFRALNFTIEFVGIRAII